MAHALSEVIAFIANKSLVSLPGGFGTTLQLEGYRLRAEAWSGEANLSASHLLERVHIAFHDAGADIHTTNTFRTHPYFMQRDLNSRPEQAEKILRQLRACAPARRDFQNAAEEISYWASKRAVDAALHVQSQSKRPVLIGGSYGPLNDTHTHDEKGVALDALRAGHKAHAQLLKELGVDLLFPETIPSLREAVSMTEAAAETGLPYITSFVLDPVTARLFDGTKIEEAVRETASPNRVGVLFNCTPASAIGPALDKLLNCYDGPVGAYPNGGGNPAADNAGWDHDESPSAIRFYVDLILNWASKDPRVKILGGCCGASPAYIQALNHSLREKHGSSQAAHPTRRRFFAEDAATIRDRGCACHPTIFAGLTTSTGPS